MKMLLHSSKFCAKNAYALKLNARFNSDFKTVEKASSVRMFSYML